MIIFTRNNLGEIRYHEENVLLYIIIYNTYMCESSDVMCIESAQLIRSQGPSHFSESDSEGC